MKGLYSKGEVSQSSFPLYLRTNTFLSTAVARTSNKLTFWDSNSGHLDIEPVPNHSNLIEINGSHVELKEQNAKKTR